MFRMLNKSAIW